MKEHLLSPPEIENSEIDYSNIYHSKDFCRNLANISLGRFSEPYPYSERSCDATLTGQGEKPIDPIQSHIEKYAFYVKSFAYALKELALTETQRESLTPVSSRCMDFITKYKIICRRENRINSIEKFEDLFKTINVKGELNSQYSNYTFEPVISEVILFRNKCMNATRWGNSFQNNQAPSRAMSNVPHLILASNPSVLSEELYGLSRSMFKKNR